MMVVEIHFFSFFLVWHFRSFAGFFLDILLFSLLQESTCLLDWRLPAFNVVTSRERWAGGMCERFRRRWQARWMGGALLLLAWSVDYFLLSHFYIYIIHIYSISSKSGLVAFENHFGGHFV
jgi:hypothetical protein